ncbi:MAG: disulfide bond formation protein B [Paracoccaceae bacterium]
MIWDRRSLVLLAAFGSAALLAGAFLFQYVGGILPCKLCYWQRWPHGAAVLIGAVALVRDQEKIWPWLGALAALTTAGLGLYHTGIERKWWQGPASCTGDGGALGGLSGADLLNPDAAPGIVMCDQVAWEMFGLSMASWNAIASLVLVFVWISATRRKL